jgi:antibiotic biosynthesis monooxygenase (ABM) superfamily enzyme
MIKSQGDHFRFGLVFIKKNNQTEIFLFKKTETGSNRFGSVFLVWLGFFPVWLGFFWFFPVLIQFGFFGFSLMKPNRSVFSKF